MKIIILITVLSVIIDTISKYCGINHLKKPQRILVKQDGENGRKLLEDKWEPIRIHLDFSYIENNIGRMKKQDVIDLRDRIMPKTKEIFEKLIKVKRIQGKLKLNAPTCETFHIPEIYNTEGVEADLVIFVLLDDSDYFKTNNVEAAAIHCLQHQTTLRPIAGYIQFKQELNVTDSTALDYMTWLALHEITHILAFNSNLYEDFIDSETFIPLGYDKIIHSEELPNGKKMNRIKSKHVIEKAKEHYGCEHFDGVPLEYNGGLGTAGSHWAKKYMNSDYMIGDSYGENAISEISLAIFEDSGWYKVDYDNANLFNWGKNKGCDFLDSKKKCIENNKSKSEEFCTNLTYPTCSISNVFRGSCKGVKSSSPFEPSERYFKDPNKAGADPLTDYCPIPLENKINKYYYEGSCRQGSHTNLNYKYEKVCPECACFMSNLKEEEENKFLKNTDQRALTPSIEELEDSELGLNDKRATCLSYKCIKGEIFVEIDEKDYKCINGKVTVQGYQGSIICPPSGKICNEKYKCKFGCIDKFVNDIPFVQFNK